MGKSAFQSLQTHNSNNKCSCDIYVPSSGSGYCAKFCSHHIPVGGCRLQYRNRYRAADMSSYSMHAYPVPVLCDKRLWLWSWWEVCKSQTMVRMLLCQLLRCLRYRSRYVNNDNTVHSTVWCGAFNCRTALCIQHACVSEWVRHGGCRGYRISEAR